MITEEIVHVKGYPKKLIVFLHGYIDSPEYIDRNINILLDGLNDVAIHIPKSPHICEIYETKYQWYSMHRFDPNDDRKLTADWEEYLSIYEKMKPGILEAFDDIDIYIDNCLNEYQLEDKDLYICGFSQGATMATFTSLMRDSEVAGVISFSGMFAPAEFLLKKAKQSPDFLLIHGTDDNQVRFKALVFVEENLKKLGCYVKTYAIPNGLHRITEDGMAQALNFISGK